MFGRNIGYVSREQAVYSLLLLLTLTLLLQQQQ